MAISTTARVIACSARGATSILIQKHNRVRATEITKTGALTRGMLTPLDLSAINSLSADMRPNTKRIAVRNPHGIVKVRENGSTNAMKPRTVRIGTSGLFTRMFSNSRKIFPRTKTKLRIKTPSPAVTRMPVATWRSMIFIRRRSDSYSWKIPILRNLS